MQLRKIVVLILLWLTAGGLSGLAQKKPTTYTTPTRNTPVGGNKAGMPSKLRLPAASISPYGRQQQASRQPTPRQLRRLSTATAGQGKTQQRANGSPLVLKPAIPPARSQPVILARSQAKPRLDRLRKQLMSSTALHSTATAPPIPNVRKFGGRTVTELSSAANSIDPTDKGRQLTKAGRALQKHSGRPGSAFSVANGGPSVINAQGRSIVDSILNNPASHFTQRNDSRYGHITDIVAPDGRGLRFSAKGELIGFLEP